MQVDGALVYRSLADAPAKVRELVALDYDGVYLFEGPGDVFLPCVLAAEHSQRQIISTQVAVAFARNPLSLAYQAHDLQMFSGGRFILGLGTQARPNIEKRYSMPWGKPVTRMREMVGALRAIFRAWNHNEPLHYVSEYYTHTKMQPMFRPAPSPHGPPPIMLGGIGAAMTRCAGEIADWFVVIPYHTPAFLEQTTFPALRAGLQQAGRSWADLRVAAQCMIATGLTEASFAQAVHRTRNQIAFYGSTPIYAKALEAEGWGDYHVRWRQMTREGRWAELADTVPDEMLHRFAVVGEPHEIAPQLHERFGGWCDRLSVMTTYMLEPEAAATVIAALAALRA